MTHTSIKIKLYLKAKKRKNWYKEMLPDLILIIIEILIL